MAPRNILGATDEKCSLDQHLEAAGLEALKEETVETHPEGRHVPRGRDGPACE